MARRHWIGLLLLVVLGALSTATVIHAIDTTGTTYSAVVTFTNTTGSTLTATRAAFPVSGAALVDDNFISSDGLNAVVTDAGTGVPSMPPTNRIDIEGAIADDGGVQTNETTAATNSTANDVTLLPTTPAVNDAYYFGLHHPGRIVTINITTAGSGAWSVAWEYWNGTTYAGLSNVSDATDGFRESGIKTASWTKPTDWAETTILGITAFFARARVTAFTSVTTAPRGTQVWWETGEWWTFIPSVGSLASEQYTLALGGPAIISSHATYPGTAGITTLDASSIELGNTYAVEVNGRLNLTGTGVSFCIVCKGAAFQVYPSSTSAITAALSGASTTTLTVSGITLPGSGSQTVSVTSDGTSVTLNVAGFGSSTGTAQTITNTTDGFTWASNNTLIYLDEGKISFPEYDTFDTQGQFNTGTVSNTETVAGQPTDLELDLVYWVESGGDDGRWSEGDSSFSSTVSISFGNAGSPRFATNTFIRFDNIPIAQGATISRAYLTFLPAATEAGTGAMTVSAIAADDALAPTSFSGAQNATRTSASVSWNIGASSWPNGVNQDSPSITPVIQEIISRSGWVANNAIVVYVEDAGSVSGSEYFAHAFDAGNSGTQRTARLTIEVAPAMPSFPADYVRLSDVGTSTGPSDHPRGWTKSTCAGSNAWNVTSDEQRSGSYSLNLPYAGSGGTCSTYQQVAASAGQVWSAGMWGHDLLGIGGAGVARVTLEFRNSSEVLLSSSSADGLDTSLLWLEIETNNQTAPATTAFARIVLTALCGTCGGTPSEAFFDRVMLCQCTNAPTFPDASNVLTNPSFEEIYQSTGTWTSPNLSSTATSVQSSSITWTTKTPENASLVVAGSTNGGSSYTTATNGGSFPGITAGQNLTGLDLRVRATLAGTSSEVFEVTPFLGFLQVHIIDADDNNLRYALNTLPGLTIADRSGNGNTGTMSFPTQPDGLSGSLGTLRSTQVRTLGPASLNIPSVADPLSGAAQARLFDTSTSECASLPFHGLWVLASDLSGGIPIQFFYIVVVGIATLWFGWELYRMGAVSISAVAMVVLLGVLGSIGNCVFPLWALLLLIPILLGLLVMRPRLAL